MKNLLIIFIMFFILSCEINEPKIHNHVFNKTVFIKLEQKFNKDSTYEIINKKVFNINYCVICNYINIEEDYNKEIKDSIKLRPSCLKK